MIKILKISDSSIIDYIIRYKREFISRVIHLVNNNTLDSIIVVEQDKPQSSPLSFKEGERMNDSEFITFVKKLSSLTVIDDKIKQLQEKVECLHDFLDIMAADCFYGEEYEKVFGSLGDTELSVLARIVFYEEIREAFFDLSSAISKYKRAESEWEDRFTKYLGKLPERKLTCIEQQMRMLDYEEISFY